MVCVVEVGSSVLRGLVCDKTPNGQFKTYACVQEDYAGYYEGEFLDEIALKESFINLFVKMESLSRTKIKQIYISVPAEFSAVSVCEFNKVYRFKHKITAKDLNAFYTEINNTYQGSDMEIIGISPTMFVLDENVVCYDVLGQKVQKVFAKYSIATGDRKFTRVINDIVQEYGIVQVSYVSENLCKATFIVPAEDRYRGKCLMVDVGALSSSLTFVSGDGIVDLLSFSVGSNHITNDLCEAFGLEYADAENLKKEIVVTLKPNKNDFYTLTTFGGKVCKLSATEVNEVATYRILSIADIIKQCLGAQKEAGNIKIVLAGLGITKISGAKNLLTNLLGQKVWTASCPYPHLNNDEVVGLYSIAEYVLDN